MSHKSTTRLISQLGKDHDQLVKKWRDSFLLDLETQPAPYTEQCENNESSFASDSSESSDDNDESLDDCGSISSGGDDDENDEDCDYNDEDDDNNDDYNDDDDGDDDDVIFRIPEQCQNGPLIVRPPQVLEASNIIKVLPGLPIEMRHKGFRLCGDNLRDVPTVVSSGRYRPPLRKNSHHSDKIATTTNSLTSTKIST